MKNIKHFFIQVPSPKSCFILLIATHTSSIIPLPNPCTILMTKNTSLLNKPSERICEQKPPCCLNCNLFLFLLLSSPTFCSITQPFLGCLSCTEEGHIIVTPFQSVTGSILNKFTFCQQLSYWNTLSEPHFSGNQNLSSNFHQDGLYILALLKIVFLCLLVSDMA